MVDLEKNKGSDKSSFLIYLWLYKAKEEKHVGKVPNCYKEKKQRSQIIEISCSFRRFGLKSVFGHNVCLSGFVV